MMTNVANEVNTGRVKATAFIEDEKGNILDVLFHAEI